MQEVIILFGGQGSERLVSVASAQNIAATIEGMLWFWRPDDSIYLVLKKELIAHAHPFENEFIPSGTPLFRSLAEALDTVKETKPVFLLALHGGKGEDGTIQKMFEERSLSFTGSGSAASQLAFDKVAAKEGAEKIGIRVPRAFTAERAELQETIEKALSLYGDIVIKPSHSGSSDGLHFLTRSDDSASIQKAIDACIGMQVIEERISGRELTVGVIEGEGGLTALPPSEVVMESGAFDYEAKYLGKSTEITPAPLSEEETREAQDIARRIHTAIGCQGYSRTDLMLGKDGFVFLEINTLPGLTRASFIPQQLAAANIPFYDFLQRQIVIARSR